jgi:hypothetical protein
MNDRTASKLILAIAAIYSMAAQALPVVADNISPGLKRRDVIYSLEKPDTKTYGTGIASRATEASALRLEAERDLQAGRIHEALRKARKAAQFDPEVADSHLVLARVMTECLRAAGYQDKELYEECVAEWRLLRWHDSNSSNNEEAAKQLAKIRIARTWSKFHPPKYKPMPI